MASKGQDSTHRPQNMLRPWSISNTTASRVLSGRTFVSIRILPCGQLFAQVQQAVQRSESQTRSQPRILREVTNRSSGYWTVMTGRDIKCFMVRASPLRIPCPRAKILSGNFSSSYPVETVGPDNYEGHRQRYIQGNNRPGETRWQHTFGSHQEKIDQR